MSVLRTTLAAVVAACVSLPTLADKPESHPSAYKEAQKQHYKKGRHKLAQLGPRPYFLIDDMDESELKSKLESCKKRPFKKTDFSIGHRGAPLQFPEHTKESYEAAAKMGAGIMECDVTFTKDKELVCRHSQCDLHTTTNILVTDLAEKCTQGFEPAVYDSEGNMLSPASAQCCTSDITLDEFKTLEGKMDAADRTATTAEAYLGGTADWRTDLYASRGTLLSHKESIALFKKLKVKMTPELKSPSVEMPFDGFSQEDYAQKMINEYKEAGVPARKVWAQSFNFDDILYWINNEPKFGKQATYLDGRYGVPDFDHRDPSTWSPSIAEMISNNLQIIAPPMWMLVEVEDGGIVPSAYAKAVKEAGLEIITWTFERSGPLENGGGWYYQTTNGLNPNPINPEPGVINNDGDMMEVLHVLAQDVGILGIFSDWAAPVTYYANCYNL